jgi:hypothetical protein
LLQCPGMNARDTLKEAIRARAFVHASPETKILERAGGRVKTSGTWLFDFRAIMLQPASLNAYAELFWERFGDSLPFQVGGPETAGSRHDRRYPACF